MAVTAPAPTVSARIHADLRTEILSGRLAPGDALSSERALSEELGANRHAVREALKRLQNVVRRVADQWRPASPNEAYHIVRQRLFVTPDADALASISARIRSVS